MKETRWLEQEGDLVLENSDRCGIMSQAAVEERTRSEGVHRSCQKWDLWVSPEGSQTCKTVQQQTEHMDIMRDLLDKDGWYGGRQCTL